MRGHAPHRIKANLGVKLNPQLSAVYKLVSVFTYDVNHKSVDPQKWAAGKHTRSHTLAISIDAWKARAKYFDFEGVRIAYWYEGAGKPLLMLHGFPTAAWDWASIWPALKLKHSLIAVDMIGFGLSDKPKDGYSIHRQADMVLALLDHLGVTEFDALVHNYGASVGQELLARQQEGTDAEGLARMVFLNSGVFPSELRSRPIMKLGRTPLRYAVSWMLNRKMFGRNFRGTWPRHAQPSEKQIDAYWSLFSAKGGARLFHKLIHFVEDREDNERRWVGALERAQKKIGMINGGLDPVSGEHAYRRWINHLPDANEHYLHNVGHYPQIEAPAEVASTTLNWLS